MNSFYLWTGLVPPTGFNATGWASLFSDELQRRIVTRLEPIEGLCLLKNSKIERFWMSGASGSPEGPLIRFMEQGFEPVATFSTYELLKKRREDEGRVVNVDSELK